MKKTLSLIILLSLFVLTQWSSSVYLPVAPKIAAIFAPSQRSLIISSLSIFFLGYALGQLFWGILSDYLGRYTSLLIALSLYFVFTLSMLMVHSAATFVWLLSITGFATAANTSVGNALIKDLYGNQTKKMIAYVGIAMAAAPVIAPVIGSHLYLLWGWQSIFITLSFLCIIILILFAINFHATRPIVQHHKQQTHSPVAIMLKTTLSDRVFLLHIGVLSICFGLFFSILLLTPFILIDHVGMPVHRVGFIMFCITLTYVIGAIFNATLAKTKSQQQVINYGFLFMLLGSLLFAANSLITARIIAPLNLIAAAICILGIGILMPASKSGAMLSRDQYTGTAASVMKFTQTLGCVMLTKVGSYCISHGHMKCFTMLLLGIMLVLASLYLLLNRTRETFKRHRANT